MDTKIARRKPFDVEYIVVTDANINEVSEWAGGTIGGEGDSRHIKIVDKNVINARQAKAFVGDLVVKYQNENKSTFKAFSSKAFYKSFEDVKSEDAVTHTVARSAESGQFVSQAEADANPDTTVVEEIRTEDLGGL